MVTLLDNIAKLETKIHTIQRNCKQFNAKKDASMQIHSYWVENGISLACFIIKNQMSNFQTEKIGPKINKLWSIERVFIQSLVLLNQQDHQPYNDDDYNHLNKTRTTLNHYRVIILPQDGRDGFRGQYHQLPIASFSRRHKGFSKQSWTQVGFVRSSININQPC